MYGLFRPSPGDWTCQVILLMCPLPEVVVSPCQDSHHFQKGNVSYPNNTQEAHYLL